MIYGAKEAQKIFITLCLAGGRLQKLYQTVKPQTLNWTSRDKTVSSCQISKGYNRLRTDPHDAMIGPAISSISNWQQPLPIFSGNTSKSSSSNRVIRVINNLDHTVQCRVLLNLKTAQPFEEVLEDLGQVLKMSGAKRMYTVAGQEVTSILLQLTYTQNSKMGTIPSRYMLKSIPPNDATLYSLRTPKI